MIKPNKYHFDIIDAVYRETCRVALWRDGDDNLHGAIWLYDGQEHHPNELLDESHEDVVRTDTSYFGDRYSSMSESAALVALFAAADMLIHKRDNGQLDLKVAS